MHDLIASLVFKPSKNSELMWIPSPVKGKLSLVLITGIISKEYLTAKS